VSRAARQDSSATRALRQAASSLWHTQRVKRLVRGRLAMDAMISVVELPCLDPACPGPATQITILGFDLTRRIRVVHRSASEITSADIESILPGLLAMHPD
jgi:hypothetical protein